MNEQRNIPEYGLNEYGTLKKLVRQKVKWGLDLRDTFFNDNILQDKVFNGNDGDSFWYHNIKLTIGNDIGYYEERRGKHLWVSTYLLEKPDFDLINPEDDFFEEDPNDREQIDKEPLLGSQSKFLLVAQRVMSSRSIAPVESTINSKGELKEFLESNSITFISSSVRAKELSSLKAQLENSIDLNNPPKELVIHQEKLVNGEDFIVSKTPNKPRIQFNKNFFRPQPEGRKSKFEIVTSKILSQQSGLPIRFFDTPPEKSFLNSLDTKSFIQQNGYWSTSLSQAGINAFYRINGPVLDIIKHVEYGTNVNIEGIELKVGEEIGAYAQGKKLFLWVNESIVTRKEEGKISKFEELSKSLYLKASGQDYDKMQAPEFAVTSKERTNSYVRENHPEIETPTLLIDRFFKTENVLSKILGKEKGGKVIIEGVELEVGKDLGVYIKHKRERLWINKSIFVSDQEHSKFEKIGSSLVSKELGKFPPPETLNYNPEIPILGNIIKNSKTIINFIKQNHPKIQTPNSITTHFFKAENVLNKIFGKEKGDKVIIEGVELEVGKDLGTYNKNGKNLMWLDKSLFISEGQELSKFEKIGRSLYDKEKGINSTGSTPPEDSRKAHMNLTLLDGPFPAKGIDKYLGNHL